MDQLMNYQDSIIAQNFAYNNSTIEKQVPKIDITVLLQAKLWVICLKQESNFNHDRFVNYPNAEVTFDKFTEFTANVYSNKIDAATIRRNGNLNTPTLTTKEKLNNWIKGKRDFSGLEKFKEDNIWSDRGQSNEGLKLAR